MRISKRKFPLLLLPLLFLSGCQEEKESILSHPSFDRLEHFKDFITGIDFTKIKQVKEEQSNHAIKNETKELMYQVTKFTRYEKNESDAYALIYSNDENENYENHRHYYYFNNKKFFSLSEANNTKRENSIPTFENGNNDVLSISDVSSTINNPKYITSKEAKNTIDKTMDYDFDHLLLSPITDLDSQKNLSGIKYSSKLENKNYIAILNYYSETSCETFSYQYQFDSDLKLLSFQSTYQAAKDSDADWDKRNHHVKNSYKQIDANYNFAIGERSEISVPTEKDAILSLFGKDALD